MRTIIRQRILSFLTQGLTPPELALTIALGVTIGLFPVLGMTTLLCTLAAFSLRLNLPALQSINWSLAPLQVLLIIPFTHAGAWIFGGTGISLSLTELQSLMETDLLGTIERYLFAVLRGVGAWTIAAVPTALLLYGISLPVLTRMAASLNNSIHQQSEGT